MIRAATDQAIFAGVTPLEVMLDNMRFYHERAEVMLGKIVAGMGRRPSAKLLQMLKDLCSFREQSQKCAAEAAPFVHPRLATIAHTGKDGGPIQMIGVHMSVEKAAELYGDMINSTRPPCLIEQQPASKTE